MQNQLIVMGHPSCSSLAKVILNDITTIYERFGQTIVLRDLYEIGFNPVVTKADTDAAKLGSALADVLIEQEYVKKADVISFIYPVWWTGMPAIMKGYIDRVFSEGFAYVKDGTGISQPLKGKKVVIINTHGKPASRYMKGGIYDSASTAPEKNIFDFLGMELVLHHFLEGVNVNTDFYLLKNKIDQLNKEIKKAMLLSNNSRLNIPTSF